MRAATSTMTARLLAEWMSLVGWLHTAVRKDSRALALFADAEDLADEAGDGAIAATAASFRGYLARLQGRPRGAIRASAAALATPGADPHTAHLRPAANRVGIPADQQDAEWMNEYHQALADASERA